MDTKLIGAVLIGLIVGVGGTLLVTNDRKEEKMMDNGMMGMHGAMGAMMSGLDGKTEDAFDRAFLAEMIVHHEGAVQMAEVAKLNAKHSEIKAMADAIISAQTTEIEQMKAWQKNWYGIQ